MVEFGAAGLMVWALLAVIVSPIPTSAALLVLLFFVSILGMAELLGYSGPVGPNWQVPSRWIVPFPARSRRLVWAALVGPGVVTRSVVASWPVAVLLLVAVGSRWVTVVAAGLAGAVHGCLVGWGVGRRMQAGGATDVDYGYWLDRAASTI